MVLQHVTRRASVVIITAARLDTDLFRHGDLDVIDVEMIPERLVNRIGKTEIDQVLDGFLAEVMVDAEDIFFRECALQGLVEVLRALEIRAERLFDDEAMTRAVRFAGEPSGESFGRPSNLSAVRRISGRADSASS